ncbi:hypothetical protein ABID21_002224 [Pseudorhizobium tarimense]|uniref:Uncharacterized protein n=1 Tax=Pseudorhizobium tarimense TaxID=1079109 RepID=A0ABV2H6D5_9HYPH|nr:hypothetical protein [Pseudorhizobium tarimense]MCJ8519070.1 hypothetical protein [Pseudorhizobium tarimense]
MDKLLSNAIDSIEVGMEDFQNGSERRLVSAVRNVYAGLLLLAKAVLWENSPNKDGSLIYYTKNKSDGTVMVKTGKTIDVKTIQERFTNLGFNPDWAPLDTIQGYRNDIEHFYSTVRPAVVQEQLGRALPLIQTLMGEYLEADPKDHFSPECWKALLESKDFFDAMQKTCIDTFADIEWESDEVPFPKTHLRCMSKDCGSYLIAQQWPDQTEHLHMELICRECGSTPDVEDVLEAALKESTAADAYIAAKNGERPPLARCPSCFRDTFLPDIGKCMICDFQLQDRCEVCGADMDIDDYNPDFEGMCASCAHSLQKAWYD